MRLAMALSLGIVAVAGIFLGIRTTFTFSSGPDRLLFAFEAVIIGGLGLAVGHAGRRHRPRRGADGGRQAVAGLGYPHRAPRLPRGAPAAPVRALREVPARGRRGLGTRERRGVAAHHDGEPTRAPVGRSPRCSSPRWSALPWMGDAGLMRAVMEFIALLVLAQMWNLLAGYAGLVSIGQQAYVGLGGYALDRARRRPRRESRSSRSRWPGSVAAALALPTAALVFRFRGRLLRGRHVGGGGGLPAARRQHRRARARHRPHAEGGVPARAGDAGAGHLRAGRSPSAWPPSSRVYALPALAAGARAHGDARQRARLGESRRRRVPHQARRLPDRGVRNRGRPARSST